MPGGHGCKMHSYKWFGHLALPCIRLACVAYTSWHGKWKATRLGFLSQIVLHWLKIGVCNMIRDKNPSLVARLFGKGEVWSGCKAGTTRRKSFPERGRNMTCRWRGRRFCRKGGADMRKLNPKRYKNGDRCFGASVHLVKNVEMWKSRWRGFGDLVEI